MPYVNFGVESEGGEVCNVRVVVVICETGTRDLCERLVKGWRHSTEIYRRDGEVNIFAERRPVGLALALCDLIAAKADPRKGEAIGK